ncbi:MAG: hypothetical protein ACC726_17020 [Chloroflexota bacterium]
MVLGEGEMGETQRSGEEHLADRFYSIDVSVGLRGAHVGALAHIGQLQHDRPATARLRCGLPELVP